MGKKIEGHIFNYNSKGQEHGYQEWKLTNGKTWLRGYFNNGLEIGYQEANYGDGCVEDEGTVNSFYIR